MRKLLSSSENSTAYKQYCKEVFGEDFSQDGFSDINEIKDILLTANITQHSTVLDMGCGVSDVMRWLKPGGTFIAMYGSDDFIEDTIAQDETAIASAIHMAGFEYEALDYTESYYLLMHRKRSVAIKLEKAFKDEKLDRFHYRIMKQSIDMVMPFEEFVKHHSRFMYIVRKKVLNLA